jgi:hypothetical protein
MRPILLLLLFAALLPGQWKKLPPAPDLKATPGKTADGKPDLSGIWTQDNTRAFLDLTSDMKPADVPYRPAAKALVDARRDGTKDEPDANCLPQGVPKINNAPAPFKIVQTPNLIVVVHEAFNLWRQIHLDGRELVDDPNPTWLGWSKGRWEGDTLVVDTRGFNGKAWLDHAGNPASDALHVTERFRRTSIGKLELEITIDDPKMYTRPWMAKTSFHLLPDTEVMEFICLENEKDQKHMAN